MALHDLQVQKFTRMFNFFDQDGDGVMELDDHLVIADRAQALRGFGANTSEAHTFRSKVTAIGTMFMDNMDRNDDGRVTLNEWLSFYDVILSAPREQYMNSVYGGIQMMLDIADADGDEKLSLIEYLIFITAFNVNYPDVPANFARLDSNGDGYISKDELMELMEQWHVSIDPADAGNYLTGPL